MNHDEWQAWLTTYIGSSRNSEDFDGLSEPSAGAMWMEDEKLIQVWEDDGCEDQYGYMTFCPLNDGTLMVMDAYGRGPDVFMEFQDWEERKIVTAEEFRVEVRGIIDSANLLLLEVLAP